MKVFLETSSKQIKKKRLSLSPWGRPLDADEVMKWFSSLEKRIYLYFERKDFKSLPSNEQQAKAGRFASLIHLYPLIQPASSCTRVCKKSTEKLVTWKYLLNPDCDSELSFIGTMANTFYQVDTEDFSNKKWPVSKSGPEPRALWRMCMYIVKLHIIPKDDQKKKKKNSNVFIG